ncbi:probable glutathione S-transferase parA [Vigna unguiculata]|uniref:probable glutathione S-transferase parA n=1 Tax=Vigna unguiculata TaxID=3917 RepID=UPI001015DCD6|nr:probable glutathione S-transferase parA [Vigna unguiculata]
MEDSNVVLLDFWPSSYGMRVKIALAEKGISYECKQEDLEAKSSLLTEMNPVHKMIPVLIHNAKPISESLNIVQYIDEAWKHKPSLLPSDPYKRSQARFWGDYIDKNVYNGVKRVWTGKGKEQEEWKKQLIECLKSLEDELGDKAYFGGEEFGYVDVALVPFTTWFYTVETFGKLSIEEECPKLVAWAKRCMQKESVATSLPHPHQIYDFALQYKHRHGLQ